ncbi:hypothetical protein KSF_009680 [Reticulibacter mediterranei]|uniref:Pentapeptide repeat-containing protein n=1 Tax=Reticulibacter mediterranei TaxID=2778369 RepID=A0A8J3IEC1_9CHLR|nr:pentapeptide repeat-containing protein [Reticulibacter mediterranei]GHO90920.1 hypothetical protein KSF_009680 [Reticulibacter mediterranei]
MANQEDVARLRKNFDRFRKSEAWWHYLGKHHPIVWYLLSSLQGFLFADYWQEECHPPTSWNRWREHHPAVQPDLSGADLHAVNLHRANLRGADLSEAELLIANLSGAKLSYADLSGADLSGANLHGTNLEQITVKRANFQGADLHGIPWLLVMDLPLQPGVNFSGIEWDGSPDEQGSSFPTL